MRNDAKLNYLLLAGAAPFNFLIYNGGRFLTRNAVHIDLTTQVDKSIPLLSWTVLIYWGLALPFWVASYCACTLQDRETGRQFILSHYIGESICFLIFVLFPTTMTRPEISSSTLCNHFLALVYRYDSPDNLLPSIHCFVSWLCWIGVRKNTFFPRWYQYISLLAAIAICLSTLTVRQHVIADVAAGIFLAELSCFIAGFRRKNIYFMRPRNRNSIR